MEFRAKTVEQAVSQGLEQMGLTEEQVEIEVKETPTKGLFGIVRGEAVVEITKKLSDLERASEFLDKMLEIMDINAKVKIEKDKENPVLTLITDDSASVIGYRGEVLEAIQTLVGAIANIGKNEYKKVVVDCENYREKREHTLISLAHRIEKKATEMRREVQLEPMSPFERRIIHTALSESQTVTTKSEGKDPNRFVVVVPFDKDEFSTPYNAGLNKDGRRNGRGQKRNDKTFRRNGDRKPRENQTVRKSSSFGFGTYLGNSLKDKE